MWFLSPGRLVRKSPQQELGRGATFVLSVEDNEDVAPGCLFLLRGLMTAVLTFAMACLRSLSVSSRQHPPGDFRQSRRLFIIPLPFRRLPSRRRFLAFGNFWKIKIGERLSRLSLRLFLFCAFLKLSCFPLVLSLSLSEKPWAVLRFRSLMQISPNLCVCPARAECFFFNTAYTGSI